MNEILRYYMPIYLLLYFGVAFVIPTYRIWRSTGINPVTFGKEDNAHNYIGMVMKIIILFLAISIITFSFGEPAYKWLSPIDYLEHHWLQVVGLILIHVSMIWISVAQYQMSKSWRIGIDEKHKTDLVTHGIFSISRNPIFLGMIISVIGLFLIIPNAITFFVATATYFIIQIQIRLEEEFLGKQHGVIYSNYKNNVRRFL